MTKRWRGRHVFGAIAMQDSKKIYLGSSDDSDIYWDGTNNRITVAVPTISGTDPGRQIYGSFTATGAVAAGKSLTPIQLSGIFNGTTDNASVTCAEFKAKHTTGNTKTVVQLRGVVGNADAKNGTVTTAYPIEASLDVSAGGTVTNGALIHANLNNSGTVTNSYVLYGEGTSSVYVDYGIYLRYCNRPLYATAKLTGSTAKNAMEVVTTDTQTNASGYSRTLYLNHTTSGAKTSSGEVNVLGIDLSITAAIAGYAYAESIYIAPTSGQNINHIAGVSMYLEDCGTGTVSRYYGIDIGKVSTHQASASDAFMRLYTASGTTEALFRVEGATTYAFDFSTVADPIDQQAVSAHGGTVYRIACRVGASTIYLLASSAPS